MCSGYERSKPNASSLRGKLASDRYAATQAAADPAVRMQGERNHKGKDRRPTPKASLAPVMSLKLQVIRDGASKHQGMTAPHMFRIVCFSLFVAFWP